LIFQSNKSAAREVSIKLDNQDIHSQWISGHWGKVTLPKISKGVRALNINNTNETWLVNHVDYVKDADYLLLKEAFSLNKRSTITYTIKKESSETLLNFTYYQELANKAAQVVFTEDTVIEVKLLNIKQSSVANVSESMSSSMTIPIRHWRLLQQQSKSEQGLILNRGNRKTNSGMHFVYSLGNDLPAGEYQIQFSLIEGSEGYLNVSRLTPKPGTEIDYFRESIHAY
jgi:hypothetical protein